MHQVPRGLKAKAVTVAMTCGEYACKPAQPMGQAQGKPGGNVGLAQRVRSLDEVAVTGG
jgi:hypothetical protein